MMLRSANGMMRDRSVAALASLSAESLASCVVGLVLVGDSQHGRTALMLAASSGRTAAVALFFKWETVPDLEATTEVSSPATPESEIGGDWLCMDWQASSEGAHFGGSFSVCR